MSISSSHSGRSVHFDETLDDAYEILKSERGYMRRKERREKKRTRKKLEKELRVEFGFFLSYLSAMEPDTRRTICLSPEAEMSGTLVKVWFHHVVAVVASGSDETRRLDAAFHALDQTLVAWRGGDRAILDDEPFHSIGPWVMYTFIKDGRYTSLDRFLQYIFRWEDDILRETLHGVGGDESIQGVGLWNAIYPGEPSKEACITRFLQRNLREEMLRDLDSVEEDGANRMGMHSRVKGLQLLEQALCESGVCTRKKALIEAVPASGSATSDIGNEK